MSNRYDAAGKRNSSKTHARHAFTCSCGLLVHGNGGKSSHRRACSGHWLSTSEAYELRKAAYDRSVARAGENLASYEHRPAPEAPKETNRGT